MSEEEFNTMHREWQEEKDRLLAKLNESNISTKFIYNRIDMLLKFTERLPELFLKRTAEEKKLIITTMTKSIKFDGENLIVNLKDTFKALQNVKKCVHTPLKNAHLRTPESSTISTKKDVSKTSFDIGAGDGT